MTRRVYIEGACIAEPRPSGIGHTARHIIQGLVESKYEVILIVPFNKVRYVPVDIASNVTIKRIFLPGKLYNAAVRYNTLPPMDIFFGRGVYIFPNFKNWPLISSVSITYIHDVYFKVQPKHIEPRNYAFLERCLGRFIQRSSSIVTVSNHAKYELMKYYTVDGKKITVIPNGVDTDIFYPRGADEVVAITSKYDLVPKKYFMFLSNLEPRKNIEKVLDAFKDYCDKVEGGEKKTALLLVGGMGWNNEAILRRIQQLQLQGYKICKPKKYVPDEDIPSLLCGAVALLHPALYEGFGISPLQAIACGIPVIVSNTSSLPEVMGASYVDYVDPEDTQSIVKRMEQVKTELHYDKSYGIQRARSMSWRRSSEKLRRLIDNYL